VYENEGIAPHILNESHPMICILKYDENIIHKNRNVDMNDFFKIQVANHPPSDKPFPFTVDYVFGHLNPVFGHLNCSDVVKNWRRVIDKYDDAVYYYERHRGDLSNQAHYEFSTLQSYCATYTYSFIAWWFKHMNTYYLTPDDGELLVRCIHEVFAGNVGHISTAHRKLLARYIVLRVNHLHKSIVSEDGLCLSYILLTFRNFWELCDDTTHFAEGDIDLLEMLSDDITNERITTPLSIAKSFESFVIDYFERDATTAIPDEDDVSILQTLFGNKSVSNLYSRKLKHLKLLRYLGLGIRVLHIQYLYYRQTFYHILSENTTERYYHIIHHGEYRQLGWDFMYELMGSNYRCVVADNGELFWGDTDKKHSYPLEEILVYLDSVLSKRIYSINTSINDQQVVLRFISRILYDLHVTSDNATVLNFVSVRVHEGNPYTLLKCVKVLYLLKISYFVVLNVDDDISEAYTGTLVRLIRRIQMMAGLDDTNERFLYTFYIYEVLGKQIVITSASTQRYLYTTAFRVIENVLELVCETVGLNRQSALMLRSITTLLSYYTIPIQRFMRNIHMCITKNKMYEGDVTKHTRFHPEHGMLLRFVRYIYNVSKLLCDNIMGAVERSLFMEIQILKSLVRSFTRELEEYMQSPSITTMLHSLYPQIATSLVKFDEAFHLNIHGAFAKETPSEESATVPDEFLDPILFTPIRIPVKLPQCGMFVDYCVISSHLLEHEMNPFNRQKLTLDELEEYNTTPQIVADCDDFIRRLNQHKEITDSNKYCV